MNIGTIEAAELTYYARAGVQVLLITWLVYILLRALERISAGESAAQQTRELKSSPVSPAFLEIQACEWPCLTPEACCQAWMT